MKKTVLITGVSSGFGYQLAKLYLENGYSVFGLSRINPEYLMKHYSGFRFFHVDLSSRKETQAVVKSLIQQFPEAVGKLTNIYLNAGVFNHQITEISNFSQSEIDHMMNVNVWSHKMILDTLIREQVSFATCVASSSIAGVRIRAGMGGYALSKATLNAAIKLYAMDFPHIFFCAIGLCNMSTSLHTQALQLECPERFRDLLEFKKRAAQEGYLADPFVRAKQLFNLVETGQLARKIKSGDFIEIRDL